MTPNSSFKSLLLPSEGEEIEIDVSAGGKKIGSWSDENQLPKRIKEKTIVVFGLRETYASSLTRRVRRDL
jgi:hypothetical protein